MAAVVRAAAAVNVELTGDPRFARRVVRLAAVSMVMLGLIWLLAVRRGAPESASVLLLAGWAAMPALLGASLLRPGLRVWLIAPSTLVTAGVALAAWNASGMARAGWALVLAGILLGDLLGLWLWMRVAPARGAWAKPFSRQRWTAIAVHVLLAVAGMLVVAAA